MATSSWRIHGDNVIECDRAVAWLAEALGAEVGTPKGAPYASKYVLRSAIDGEIEVTCLPGYGRWGVDIPAALRTGGARLREAGDAVVTEVSGGVERILLAMEFCSALPAGNNAWQRSGRALAFAEAGVPYLYFAEVGGVELGASRAVKAPRFPNPIVPFSYVCASSVLKTLCLPVYLPSPSSSQATRELFEPAFGRREAAALTAKILRGADPAAEIEALRRRALAVVETLSVSRKRRSTLSGAEWADLLDAVEISDKIRVLEGAKMFTKKRAPTKVNCTASLRRLVAAVNTVGCLAPGAIDIPIAVVPAAGRERLREAVHLIYGDSMAAITDWLGQAPGPVVLVWVTGFKPTGEDSRPDRGLLPLTRMLFGDEVDVLTVLWGPGRQATLRMLRDDPALAARTNGLLEAVANLSDAVIVDSVTLLPPFAVLPVRADRLTTGVVEFTAASETPVFSEHDIDSVLHRLFTSSLSSEMFECMCNPPGGDWSGLSVAGADTDVYRWTSLPRVSGPNTKRPDHVVQMRSEDVLLAVESKTSALGLEVGIGPRMERYVKNLVATRPTTRASGIDGWTLVGAEDSLSLPSSLERLVTAGAFVWAGVGQMRSVLGSGQLDLVVGVEFFAAEQRALLHMVSRPDAVPLVRTLSRLAREVTGLEVQEH